MFKKLLVIVLVIFWAVPTYAQLDPYKYRIGGGYGYTNYYGDLSPYRINEIENLSRHFDYNPNYIPEASYVISLEGRLSRSLSLMMSAGQYQLSMSDRYMDKDGNLQSQLPNFNRSLNFKTTIQDAGLALVFRTDNDRILNKSSFMAPYFTLGAGIFQFDVKGDLLDDAGLPYDYSDTDVVTNRRYETNLRPLNTELDESYPNQGFYYGLGLGIRFKIAKQIELFVQSDFKHSSSDYLDDVSGVYRESYSDEFQAYAAMPGTNEVTAENRWRGDENGRNDWYIYHHAGIKISLAPSKQAFRASKISPGITHTRSLALAQMEEDSLRLEADTLAPSLPLPANQYFNFFQINPPMRKDEQLTWRVIRNEETIGLLEDQQQEEFYNREIEGLFSEIDSLNERATALANLEEPTAQDLENLRMITQRQATLTGKVDSLGNHRMQINERIILRNNRLDSLNQIKFNEPEGFDSSVDTLLFNEGFRDFYGVLNRSLIQDDNWRQLSQGIDQPVWQSSGNMTQNQPADEDFYLYSFPGGGGQGLYDNQTVQPQPYRSYSYIPQDPVRGNIYVQGDPNDRDRNSRIYRENRQPGSTIIYQTDPQRSRRLNQGRNTIVPVFVPRGGNSNVKPEQNSVGDSLQNQSNLTENTQADSISVGSIGQLPSSDGSWQTQVDTFYLDKEILIGLPNSKKEVYFGINKEILEEREVRKLQEIVSILEAQPDFYLTLSGFADNTGDISYNLQLVEKRVNHVKSLLTDTYGVSANRISIKPGGLLIRNKNRASRNEDRKVELIIYDPASIR